MSVDSLRKNILIYTTIVTLGLVLYANGTLSLSEVFSYGSIASIPGVVWIIFDRWGWRCAILRRCLSDLPPNLNGIWTGASIPEGETGHPISYIIEQTYSNIFITSDSERVYSPCKKASLYKGDNGTWYLTFTWEGIFKENVHQRGRVTGATFLCIDTRNNAMRGDYLASGEKLSRGQIAVEKEKGC